MNSATKSNIIITAHGKMLNSSLSKASYLQVKTDLANNNVTSLITALSEEFEENRTAHNEQDCVL
jgi:hypothetical protein